MYAVIATGISLIDSSLALAVTTISSISEAIGADSCAKAELNVKISVSDAKSIVNSFIGKLPQKM